MDTRAAYQLINLLFLTLCGVCALVSGHEVQMLLAMRGNGVVPTPPANLQIHVLKDCLLSE